ncbi:MAG: VOC family protein [Knoellia sp.]
MSEGTAPTSIDEEPSVEPHAGGVTRLLEVVWAAEDVSATMHFLCNGFDFEVIENDGDQVLLGAPGSDAGRIRVVPAEPPGSPLPQRTSAVWDPGPRLLGIYSRDLEATMSGLADLGAHTLPVVGYPYGAAQMHEAVARGLDGVWWTIPQVPEPPMTPQPSPALADPARRHSELHSAVIVADDHEAAVRFFVEGGGMHVVFDGVMEGEPFERLVGLPEGGTLRLAFLVGPDKAPGRLEIMSFPGHPGNSEAVRGRARQRVGIQRLVLGVRDLEATRARLVSAGATHDETDSRGLVGPSGVRLVLVEDVVAT